MRKLLTSMTVFLASLAALTANAADSTTQTYVGGRSDVVMACGVNGACFTLAPGSSSADVSLVDVTGQSVGAHYRFKSGSGSSGAGVFCGSASLAVPPGATNLYILVMPVSGCAEGIAGSATVTTS